MYWNLNTLAIVELPTKFNLNMRCIETVENQGKPSFEELFNLNMRCIETQAAAESRTWEPLFNLNMRCIET